MKTDAQLERTELELEAIDRAYATMQRLDYRPEHDSWFKYLRAFESTLQYEIVIRLLVAHQLTGT